VIAVASTKGGVTKTITCANLAGIFADFGMQVLLFIEQRAEHGLTRVITRGGLVTEDCISKTAIPGIDIVCSDAVAGNLQTWLKDREGRLLIMRRAVRRSAAVEKYHAIIIDTQGGGRAAEDGGDGGGRDPVADQA